MKSLLLSLLFLFPEEVTSCGSDFVGAVKIDSGVVQKDSGDTSSDLHHLDVTPPDSFYYKTFLPVPKTPGWDSLKFFFGRWNPSPAESDPGGRIRYRRSDTGKPIYNFISAFSFYSNGSLDLKNGSYSIELKWGLLNNDSSTVLLMTPSLEPIITFQIIKLDYEVLDIEMKGTLSTIQYRDSVFIMSSNNGVTLYKGGWRVPGTEDASALLNRFRFSTGYVQMMPEADYEFKNFFFNASHRSSGLDRLSSRVKLDFAFEVGVNVLIGIDNEDDPYTPFAVPYLKFGPELRLYRNLFLSGCFGLAGAAWYAIYIAPFIGTNLFYLMPLTDTISIELESGFHTSFVEAYLAYISVGISL